MPRFLTPDEVSLIQGKLPEKTERRCTWSHDFWLCGGVGRHTLHIGALMMVRILTALLLIGVGLGFSGGAWALGKRPFKMIQFCVHDQDGLKRFKQTLSSIANDEGMQFFDGSAELDRQLAKAKVDMKRPVVYVGVKREDGSGLEAGNLGLDRFEIAIGFSEGKMPAEARSFSFRVERALAERWNVHAIPPDKGAAPTACRAGSDPR
ncbi:hypothetical protein [Stenotrophomonas maltophilia]|nr:hypothetical protein [Stenotrophomonas maltophilia]